MSVRRYVLALAVLGGCGFPRPPLLDGTSEGDFAMELANTRIRVVEGASTTVGVKLVRSGLMAPVTVTVAGLPTGVTADPLTVDAEVGTLTLRATTDALQGDAAPTITATADGLSHDAKLSLLTMGPPGTLDRSFGAAGTAPMPSAGTIQSIAVQTDGKILIAGATPNQTGTPTFMVARYLPDGTLDRSFTGGMVLLKGALSVDVPTKVALQPDGKILIATTFGNRSTQGLIVRLNVEGTRDDTFGINGEELITIPGSSFTFFNDIVVQPDSKIVVAGYANGALIARILPTGMLDEGFGTTGYTVFTGLGASAPQGHFLALALQSDGRIVTTGFGTPPGDVEMAAFARFTPNGQLDNHFNGVGYLTTTAGSIRPFSLFSSIAFQRDGKILVTGDSCFCLVRLLGNDGSLDKGIGFGGVVDLPGTYDGTIQASILQPDGKLVSVGGAQIDGVASAFITRATPDLHSDTTFGNAGSIVMPGVGAGRFQAVALDNEGRILAAGHQAASASDPMLYRIWP